MKVEVQYRDQDGNLVSAGEWTLKRLLSIQNLRKMGFYVKPSDAPESPAMGDTHSRGGDDLNYR